MSAPRDATVERVLAQVRALVPVDEREAASQRATLAFVAGAVDPFSELADPHHVTASAFVLSVRGVVLHRHRLLGRWLQPGGHVDPGETPEEAALREVREETGLAATPLLDGVVFHVDVHPGPRGHTHYDLRYVFAADPVEPSPAVGESTEVLWCALSDAATVADPDLTAALAKLAATAGTLERGTLGG